MRTEKQQQFLEDLVRRYGDMLTDYAWRFFAYQPHMLPVAQDAVQEVFLKAVRHVDQLMQHPNQTAWLKTVLKHTLISLYRSRKRRPELLCEDITQLASVNREQAAEAIARWEQQGRLEDVLRVADAILTSGEQETFRDHFLTGLTAAETALLEEISSDTVRGRIFRIRKKLKAYFNLSVLFWIIAALYRLGGE